MNLTEFCHVKTRGCKIGNLRNANNKTYKNEPKHKHSNGISSLSKPGDKLLATFVNQMVASAFELPSERLLRFERGNAQATRARQISIYLMHTGLSFSLSKISKIYKKDRTTIGYACRVVEDLRDNPAFDDRIIELEQTISTVLKLASYIPEHGGCDVK